MGVFSPGFCYSYQKQFTKKIRKIARAFSVWYFANQIEYTEYKTVRCVKDLVCKVWPPFTWSQICFGLNFIHFHCSIYCSLMFHFLFAYSFVERFGRQTRWDWETKIGKLEISFSRPRNDGNTCKVISGHNRLVFFFLLATEIFFMMRV